MNKPQTWFTDRIGADVLRDGKRFTIKNEKEAQYHYSLQTHFKYEAPVIIHSGGPPSTCVACEG